MKNLFKGLLIGTLSVAALALCAEDKTILNLDFENGFDSDPYEFGKRGTAALVEEEGQGKVLKVVADGKKGPAEWYGEYLGNMSIQKALERSANTIPCKVLQEMGIENSYKFLTEKLGFKHLNEIDKNLASLALGGCNYGITTTESAAAYAIFGNGGKYFFS